MEIVKYQLGNSELLYIPRWVDNPDEMYQEARKLSFTEETVTMHNRTSIVERETVDYGLPYSYNKTAKPSIEWEPLAVEIRQRLEALVGVDFPQCACNKYGSPSAYIGSHRDKNTMINGKSERPKLIASLSLGNARKMVFVPKEVHMTSPTVSSMSKLRDALVFELLPGSLVLFSDEINWRWKHAIPKDSSARGERISLTYRKF